MTESKPLTKADVIVALRDIDEQDDHALREFCIAKGFDEHILRDLLDGNGEPSDALCYYLGFDCGIVYNGPNRIVHYYRRKDQS